MVQEVDEEKFVEKMNVFRESWKLVPGGVAFINYINNTWFDNTAIYPPQLWAQCKHSRQENLDMTNNEIERYHRSLNELIPHTSKRSLMLKEAVDLLKLIESKYATEYHYNNANYKPLENIANETNYKKRKATSQPVVLPSKFRRDSALKPPRDTVASDAPALSAPQMTTFSPPATQIIDPSFQEYLKFIQYKQMVAAQGNTPSTLALPAPQQQNVFSTVPQFVAYDPLRPQ
jgi:hypothetical protein